MTSSALHATDGAGGGTRGSDGSDAQIFPTRKQYSVLTMNTLAFTVNFAIWTMFSELAFDTDADDGEHGPDRKSVV